MKGFADEYLWLTAEWSRLTRIAGHTFIAGLLSKNSKVLDLGANRGEFSLEVQRRWGCEVHAVEPTPELANILRNSGQLNVHEVAVNQHSQTVLFKIDKINSEASIIVTIKDDDVINVSAVKLDDLLKNISGVDLIKIDVEGNEIEILSTVSDELIKQIPQITVEFHDFKKESGVTSEMVSKICERMRVLGFEVFVMSYWTYGDVLFVNKRYTHLNTFRKAVVQIKGRWIPGILRTLRRLRRAEN